MLFQTTDMVTFPSMFYMLGHAYVLG